MAQQRAAGKAACRQVGDHVEALRPAAQRLYHQLARERGQQHPVPRITMREKRISDPPEMRRSEEHTSELQSLMRISYAVFCLKKKTLLINNLTLTTVAPIS